MSDLGIQIFEKYGSRAILVLVIAFVVIWAVAHWTAAPGQQVSVLWGLVSYTKNAPPPESARAVDVSSNKSDASSKNIEPQPVPLPKRTLEIANGITQKATEALLTGLRTKYALRELSALESDIPLSSMPSLTYGYVYLGSMEFNNTTISHDIELVRISRYPETRCYAELHSLPQERFLIMFLSASEASKIATLSGTREINITAAPYVRDEFTSLVEIPVSRIRESHRREINVNPDLTLCVLDLTVI